MILLDLKTSYKIFKGRTRTRLPSLMLRNHSPSRNFLLTCSPLQRIAYINKDFWHPILRQQYHKQRNYKVLSYKYLVKQPLTSFSYFQACLDQGQLYKQDNSFSNDPASYRKSTLPDSCQFLMVCSAWDWWYGIFVLFYFLSQRIDALQMNLSLNSLAPSEAGDPSQKSTITLAKS